VAVVEVDSVAARVVAAKELAALEAANAVVAEVANFHAKPYACLRLVVQL
jgi:hypothetical protein